MPFEYKIEQFDIKIINMRTSMSFKLDTVDTRISWYAGIILLKNANVTNHETIFLLR